MLRRLVVAVALLTATGWACSCSGPQPVACPGLGGSGFIFVGTVVGIENPPPPDSDRLASRSGVSRYTFRVDETITPSKDSEVVVNSGRGGADCSWHFLQGKQYLVYAYGAERDGLHTNICSPTRSIEHATAILPQLRAMRDGQPVANLFGTLRRVQQPYTSIQLEDFDQPLGEAKVRLVSKARRLETTTDEQGVFAFYDVPGDEYRFSADVPASFELAQTILSEPLPPVKLAARACFEHDLEALPTGRIRGRVVGPDGRTVPNVSVELYRAELYKDGQPGWWEFQGDEGFEFQHVAEGDYVVVFNRMDRLDPGAPYPRTFYRNSPDFVRADRIHLSPGESLSEVRIEVSGGRQTRELRVRVAGSKPDTIVFVSAKGTEGDSPFAKEIEPGLYLIPLLLEARYTISAREYCGSVCKDNVCRGASARTPNVVVDGADSHTYEIVLTFARDACVSVPDRVE